MCNDESIQRDLLEMPQCEFLEGVSVDVMKSWTRCLG